MAFVTSQRAVFVDLLVLSHALGKVEQAEEIEVGSFLSCVDLTDIAKTLYYSWKTALM